MNVRPPRATRSDTLFPSTSLVRSPGSRRIHSRYLRRLTDLPIAGHPVLLLVKARRFYCDAVLCGRHIFTERFESGLLAPWARRTARLDHIVHHLSLALGGRPAANFARRLMLPVSNATLLRVVRRYGGPPIGSASCRESVCQYGLISVVPVSLKKKKQIT